MDWHDMEHCDAKYELYLQSPEWGQKRLAVRERCLGVCERCRTLPQQHTHHLTYINRYNEPLEDLQGVCRACHKFIHGRIAFDPAEAFAERIRLKALLKQTTDHAAALEIIRMLTAMPLVQRVARLEAAVS